MTATEQPAPDAVGDPSAGGGACLLPASFAQRRLWFIDQVQPGSPAYNLAAAYRVEGALDPLLLAQALAVVVERHETLRTTFQTSDDEPVQVIAAPPAEMMALLDFRDLPEDEREAQASAAMAAEAAAPFDLAAGPLFRARLAQLSEREAVLLLTLHHIVSDHWSQEVLMSELTVAYEALRQGGTPQLPELPIQYADFAAWQREQLAGAELQGSLTYWQGKLDGLAPLEIPPSIRRQNGGAPRGAALNFEIAAAIAPALRALAVSARATPFILFLAAWKTLLFRYTAQADVAVGSPITNRSRSEIEPLIGFFLNTLVLRTDLAGNPSFRALLERVRETVLGAFAHQELPFELLVEMLQPVRVAGRNPLFNVAFVLLPGGARAWTLPGLTFTPLPPAETHAKFDLTLSIDEQDGAFSAALHYDADRFDESFVAGMARQFQTLLEGIAAEPDAGIAELPLLPPPEAAHCAVQWNPRENDFSEERGLAALFENQVARNPEAIALECGDQTVMYADLNAAANRVARHLQTLGVAPGAAVGVCLERSCEWIGSLLAILKLGAAYVPLDPATPAVRLAEVLRASGASIVLTDSASEKFAEIEGLRVIAADVLDVAAYDDSNLPAEPGGERAAYLIFTSGSTGQPKGVVIPHRAVARLVLNADYAPLTSDDTVAHASNVAFDAATFEIWGALLNGGRLAIVPRELLLSVHEFADFLTARGITTLFLTTALFHQFARQLPAAFQPLRHLLFGGEICSPESVRRVLEAGPPQRLVQVYGPTEATTFATWQLVTEVPEDALAVPIGLPIAHTTVHLLDELLQSVPPGVIGEIFIGGPGLALGYLADPDLSAQRFVETPFGRLYRTGDLARRRPEGELVFHGRRDAQFKLRGFRIEPGEIVAALERHPAVAEAGVFPRMEGTSVASVAACLVARSDSPASSADLRAFLAERLPACMVPAEFIWVERLPLTANGKLDARRSMAPEALPAIPAASQPAPPRTALEEQIGVLWSAELGRNHFSLDDDFFLAGGHSLLAIRLLGRLRESFRVEVPVQRLFATPTIRGLAEYIAARLPAPDLECPGSLVMIQRGEPGRQPLFLVPGGWGSEVEFLVYGQFARQLDPALPLYGLGTRDSTAQALPEKSVEQFAAGFVEDLIAFQPAGPFLLGGECVGGVIAYEMARQLTAAGREVTLLLLLDTDWPTRKNLAEFEAWHRRRRRTAFWEARVFGPWRAHCRNLAQLSLPGKLRYLWARRTRQVVSFEGPPAGGERDGLLDYPRRLMAHQPQPHGGKVTLVIDEEARARSGNLGWDVHHPGELEIHIVPGDHVSYIREHAPATAATLREILARACHPHAASPGEGEPQASATVLPNE